MHFTSCLLILNLQTHFIEVIQTKLSVVKYIENILFEYLKTILPAVLSVLTNAYLYVKYFLSMNKFNDEY